MCTAKMISMSILFRLLLFVCSVFCGRRPEPYYGVKIGPLQNFAHGIDGTVYAVDDSTIFVKNFSYDGTGPDAFFWIGNSPRPSPEGYIIPYPEDYVGRDPPVLSAYKDVDVILRLPMGKRIKDIRWLSVWCRRFTVDFGEVFIPPNLEVPKPRVLPEFKRLAHGLRSDNISVLDAKTIYIPNLHYDGAGPDAYFWVGNGTDPTSFGIKVPNEMGSLEPLRGYQGEDIEIQLPGTITVYDIDWIAVWCVQHKQNFGHVFIPKDLDVPPALGQTKISTSSTNKPPQSTNCREFLDKRLQVQWIVKGDLVQITLSARIREDQYVSFGLSGAQNRPQMVGADVTVAYYDATDHSFHAVDYYLSHTAQCDGKAGVCPDTRIGGRDDVTLVSGSRRDDVTTVTYTRPLQTNEAVNDRAIPAPSSGQAVSVIAAFGPLNARREANAHSISDKTTEGHRIDFGAMADHQCTGSLYEAGAGEEEVKPWPPARIVGENTFSVRIGPTGGKRGYSPQTGQPSWGIAWYINNKLIPELVVERGQTYSFLIEGGNDSTNPTRYHPFYITSSPEGGYGQKSEREQRKQKIYAGMEYNKEGYPIPTAAGRYCEWTHKSIDKSAETETFEEYVKTLRLECEDGEPAYLNWTVPMGAPDTLYYQCYTHNNLGWKISVVDPGYIDKQNGGSINSGHTCMPVVALAAICILTLSALSIHTRGRIF